MTGLLKLSGESKILQYFDEVRFGRSKSFCRSHEGKLKHRTVIFFECLLVGLASTAWSTVSKSSDFGATWSCNVSKISSTISLLNSYQLHLQLPCNKCFCLLLWHWSQVRTRKTQVPELNDVARSSAGFEITHRVKKCTTCQRTNF